MYFLLEPYHKAEPKIIMCKCTALVDLIKIRPIIDEDAFLLNFT